MFIVRIKSVLILWKKKCEIFVLIKAIFHKIPIRLFLDMSKITTKNSFDCFNFVKLRIV